MPWSNGKSCSVSICGAKATTHGKCADHQRADYIARRPNGTPYSTAGHRAFRTAVLERDPVCVECGTAPSQVADHYPTERIDLIQQGLDPNDPRYGRGLCKPCHDVRTGRTRGFGRTSRAR